MFVSGTMLRNRLFNLIFIAACAIPFAGMAVYTGSGSAGNESAAEWPSLLDAEGALNSLYLSEIGDYIEDHFAFRSECITLNSLLRIGVLCTSTDEDVIAGTDNWLYYAATLDDYQHLNNVSDRILFNEAHNIALVQEWAEANGKTFLFTIAPNKNTLYPEHMPSSLNVTFAGESDFERLTDYLLAEGVNYVDMVSLFEAQDEVLYYARDSHWTETGAVLAYNALLDAGGIEHETYEDTEPVITTDYYGDLSEMIYPSGMYPEEYELYLTNPSFLYVTAESSGASYLDAYLEDASGEAGGQDGAGADEEDSGGDPDSATEDVSDDAAGTDEADGGGDSDLAAEDVSDNAAGGVAAADIEDASVLVEQDTVVTYNAGGSGSLYMYRDSFGNSLLPYMAETFETAVFTEIVPWDLTSDEVLSADVIIMEKVERHLPTLSAIAPVMAAVEQNLTFSYTSGTVIRSGEKLLSYLVTGEETLPDGEIIEADDSLLAEDSSFGTIEVADTLDGNYIEITGTVSEDLCAVNGRIYAAVTDGAGTKVYEAFCVNTDDTDYGYTLYLAKEELEGDILNIRIVVRNGSVWTCVCEYRPAEYDEAMAAAEALAGEILETYGADDPALAWQRYLAVQEAEALSAADEEDAAEAESAESRDSVSADDGDDDAGAEPEDGDSGEEEEDLSTVEVSRRYIEDCGLDTGYWDITYADGHHEYIDN